jgi:Flp pilus assembly protein TadD
MRFKKFFVLATAACFALAGMSGAALSQGTGKAPEKAKPAAQIQKLTVVGKIAKDKAMGGYYIQGEKPPEVYHIANQNAKVLEKYAKSGKSVTIETQVVMGDNLAIEMIDGKKYQEGKAR